MSKELEKFKEVMLNGGSFIPMPPEMIKFNANIRCDMWVGPCACGVRHKGIRGFFEEHRYLSNYHLSLVALDDVLYPCVENAFQAAKTLDLEQRKYFTTKDPAQAKRDGQKVILRDDWELVKNSIMEDLIRQKFSQEELKNKLQATGDVYLEETNWWKDTYWGVCDGIGKNTLGKILMKVREEVKKGEANE